MACRALYFSLSQTAQAWAIKLLPKCGAQAAGAPAVMGNDGDFMDIITRAEAKARGLTRYFTGKPCPRGHVAERITNEAKCSKCERERSSKWSEANREKISEHQRKYREANREKIRERQRKYRQGGLVEKAKRKRA